MKKYLVLGGIVMSRHDFDLHHVNAHELMRRYKVDPKECLILDAKSPHTESILERNKEEKKFIVLRPDYSGRYKLPQPQDKD